MAHAHAATTHIEEPEHHGHPTEAQYIRIAIILSIITIVEVAIYYIEGLRGILVPTLVALSTLKFVLVVGFFMHLKFDDRRLTWIFAAGMATALAIYLATWALMHYHEITSYLGGLR